MTNIFRGNFWVKNNDLLKIEVSQFLPESSVYEVLRVIDGIPLFWEDHYQRFLNSIKLSGLSTDLTQSQFGSQLKRLIVANKLSEGNIKIDFVNSILKEDIFFYFIPHKYPTENDYVNGVKTILMHAERKNPKAKIHQHSLREKANQQIKELGVFEVLLVNKQNQLTEGSRTNVFFVKDSQFFTSPESLVLSGITRQKVIHCIERMGERINEATIGEANLADVDAAFLTGTSPKILPINQIDKMGLNVTNKKMIDLILMFDQYINEYLSSTRAYFYS